MGSLLSNPVVGRAKIQLHPEGEHSRTLIWLHGFRAYAEEFVDVFEDSKLCPVDANTKVILLNAGMKKISIAYGMKMNSWFNIYSKDYKKLDSFLDTNQLDVSCREIAKVIHKEVHTNLGGDYSKIMIGGFSQGAAVALYVAAKLKVEEYFDDSDNEIISRSSKRNSKSIKRRVKRHHRNSIDDLEILDKYYAKTHRSRFKDLTSIKNKEREDIDSEEDKNEDASVGAVIFCSGLHLFKKPEKEIFKINKFPIFVCHGIYDEMVDCDYSIRPFMKLSKDYPDIEVNTEEMGHTMSNDEWIQIQNFIQKISCR